VAPVNQLSLGTGNSAPRLTSVDALRGLVMVIMALDHTRDFFHAGAMTFSPEDLSQTTPILFFTRWVTHICAPVFLFTSGMGAFLRLQRPGATKAQLSRFLWTRGLWLILIELTVMRLGFNFSFTMQYPVLLLVLWALGISMIALAALIYLPLRVLAGVSVAVILLHNAFDSVQASQFGSLAGVWNALHQPGVVLLAGVPVIVGYPVMPWVAVMAAGFCAGTILLREPQERRRLLTTWGTVLIVAFVVVRAVNVYGDPAPWSSQPSPMFTLLSFLRTTKYPPSLAFLLMTIGPALLLLAWFDRRELDRRHPLVIVGRVPFFYYVTHFWALHLLAACMAWLKYGAASFPYLLAPVPSMGGPRDLFPPDFGYSLWVVYLVWVGIVAAVYPLCRWFAGFKARRRDWWLSYV
jgi:uncharacterized membrane protein